MKHLVVQWTLNKKLGLFAGILGFLALFLGNPYQGSRSTVDAKELGIMVQTEVDHVEVEVLADWIIRSKSDFRLIDTRSEAEFTQYHVPGAENVRMSDFADYPIQRNEKIVLYSEGGIHSAQAWFLLKAKNFKGVYILRGGLEEWKDKILFPRLPDKPTAEEQVAFNKAKEVSKFFGGTPQTGSAAEKVVPQLTMPKLEMTTPNPGTAKKKKTKEGC